MSLSLIFNNRKYYKFKIRSHDTVVTVFCEGMSGQVGFVEMVSHLNIHTSQTPGLRVLGHRLIPPFVHPPHIAEQSFFELEPRAVDQNCDQDPCRISHQCANIAGGTYIHIIVFHDEFILLCTCTSVYIFRSFGLIDIVTHVVLKNKFLLKLYLRRSLHQC